MGGLKTTIKENARKHMNDEDRREEYENKELIEYRLSNIEKTLSKMEVLLSNNKLQDRDIEDLKEKSKKFDERIKALEIAPDKAKAAKWNTAIDTVFKLALTACVSVILVKVGLK